MPELIIATRNKGKLKEFRELLPGWQLFTLDDIGFSEEIEEPFHTFRENAAVKARTVSEATGKAVLAEDSGISAAALGGAPGVHSARYAGERRSDARNLARLLEALSGEADRSAWYTAMACLWMPGREPHFFEGICRGTIAQSPSGSGGFGYDPIFIPDGYSQTFGELPPEVKNRLSHRGAAIRKLAEFLRERGLI